MITIEDIKKASSEIRDIIHVTPIITSSLLNELCGNKLYLKAEHLQKTGSFKIRGATNKVKKVQAEGAQFLTTASSGNHGQAVAYIANQLRIPATIVVPEDANIAKVNAIQSYNSEVVAYGLNSDERARKAIELAKDKNGIYIPPYDDPSIIAGQGTVGLEILDQVPDVDIVIVPIGGGGLISGILSAVKALNPRIKVIGVEPETANDMYLSLQNKKITTIPNPTTIADGLTTTHPGELTFPIVMKYVDDLVVVSEDMIKNAMQIIMERTKQLIEPSSAVTIAAILSGKIQIKNRKIVAVMSGGNVDLKLLSTFLP